MQRGEHSLCGINLDGDGHIGAPQDVGIDPHRPPDFPILCQPPQEIQGGPHGLKTLEVQFDTCREEAEGLGNWPFVEDMTSWGRESRDGVCVGVGRGEMGRQGPDSS